MRAEIISIGDEILIGHTIDSNSSWLCDKLDHMGFQVRKISVIRDDEKQIKNTLDEAMAESDLILMTGGLGPTNDDLTMSTLASYFESDIVFSNDVYEDIKKYLGAKDIEVNKLNRSQAEVPEKSTPLTNREGTAPGMWFGENEKVVVSMPGVPHEMKTMFEKEVEPRVSGCFDLPEMVHEIIKTQGIAESVLAEKLQSWEENLPGHIKLAYLPSPGMVKLRLSAVAKEGKKKPDIKKEIEEQLSKVREIIPDQIFGYGDETMESVVGKLLRDNKKTLCTAESCTGGFMAHRITSVPGSSDYFLGSIISYHNQVKIDQLGVEEKIINEKGAVSREVVEQMAMGAREKMNSDYAISVSGIAGPGGGTKDKPVGTVWIGIAFRGGVKSERFSFGKSRSSNIKQTALQGLNMLREEVLKGS